MNPLDEVLTHPHMQKNAMLGDAVRGFMGGARSAFSPQMLGGEAVKGVAGAAAGALALAAVPAAKKIWDSIQSRRVFKEMVQVNPELANAQQADPVMFNAAYNSLRRINPVYAGDPLVAGALLSRMMGPDADLAQRAGIVTQSVRPPEGPRSSLMLSSRLGPFQLNHSI